MEQWTGRDPYLGSLSTRGRPTLRHRRRLGVCGASPWWLSLGSLRSLPIDNLKLDQSFIGRMRDSAADRTIVRAVIELAHGLDLEVTAEGVEDETALAMLQEMGCDAIQGFVTGRPVSPDQFHWLRSAVQAAEPSSR